jgi:transposase
MVLLSAQGMPVARIAEVTFTSADRVRDVIHGFDADGFESLYPKCQGGRPRTFTLPERREIKKIAKSKQAEHGLPFSTWSLAKPADFLVAEGVVEVAVRICADLVAAQRIKLATELQRGRRGHALYLLDEPTAGPHPADIALLLRQLHKLVATGNTVVLVEHDLDAIATADRVIEPRPRRRRRGRSRDRHRSSRRGRQSRGQCHRAVPREAACALLSGRGVPPPRHLAARGCSS